jgi:hypothetical protein
MEVFRKQRLAEFEEKLERHLAEFAAGAPPAAFLLRIRKGVGYASAFGLERESDIARFLTTAFRRGCGFPDVPLPDEALAVLYAYGMDPVVKLDRFDAWCRTENQEEPDGRAIQ